MLTADLPSGPCATVTPWNVLCDFDGTISVEDVIDSLLDRYGRPGWQALERDWRAGRIGSRECMAGQVALLDVSREELDGHLDGLGIDPGFASFVDQAGRLGLPLRIVSDGLDYAIHSILARHDLHGLEVAANHLRQVGPRRWALDSPWQANDCRSGTCKCACAGSARGNSRRTLLIGDGASDFCAADRVDFVFAKNRLIEHCRASGIPYQPITSFDEASALLPALLSYNRLSPPFLPALAGAASA